MFIRNVRYCHFLVLSHCSNIGIRRKPTARIKLCDCLTEPVPAPSSWAWGRPACRRAICVGGCITRQEADFTTLFCDLGNLPSWCISDLGPRGERWSMLVSGMMIQSPCTSVERLYVKQRSFLQHPLSPQPFSFLWSKNLKNRVCSKNRGSVRVIPDGQS